MATNPDPKQRPPSTQNEVDLGIPRPDANRHGAPVEILSSGPFLDPADSVDAPFGSGIPSASLGTSLANVIESPAPLPSSFLPADLYAVGASRSNVIGLESYPQDVAPDESVPRRGRTQPARRAGVYDLLANGQFPPWLVSAVVHMSLLLLLGLWAVSTDLKVPLSLEASVIDRLGEQLEDPSIEYSDPEIESVDDPDISWADLPLVEDPLASPSTNTLVPDGMVAAPMDFAPNIGLALTGREKGMKQSLLKAFGGTGTTEAAVLDGLKWLARQQRDDGSWSLKGPYPDGSYAENSAAATAMAMLAFQGAGHTHLDRTTSFQKVVQRGLTALLEMEDDEGNFFQRGPSHQQLYTQAQCTIAICELYGMTRDQKLREPAQRAVDYCVRAQGPEGGWRYQPRLDSDTSVTGWFVMALQSARMASLKVPPSVLENVTAYLDVASVQDGRRYLYHPGEPFQEGSQRALAMTAEGLLCRQYLGWTRDDPRLRDGVGDLTQHLVNWDRRNVYYWYYATQVCHHMEGAVWAKWNRAMRQVLPDRQEKEGREGGSWSPHDDEWGPQGGRLYVTCLSIYMLEVYYRHLPIYR